MDSLDPDAFYRIVNISISRIDCFIYNVQVQPLLEHLYNHLSLAKDTALPKFDVKVRVKVEDMVDGPRGLISRNCIVSKLFLYCIRH